MIQSIFYFHILVLTTQISRMILTHFPKAGFTVTFSKGSITYCSSTEWNVPCTNSEVTDRVKNGGGCLRVRGSHQPCCFFKHRGQYKRSSLTTTHSPPGILVEMISIPARLQWGASSAGQGMDNVFTPPQKVQSKCELNYTPVFHYFYKQCPWIFVEVIFAIDLSLIPSVLN